MHQSSREAMAKALATHVSGVSPFPSDSDGVIHVVDVGSFDVNGTYRDFFGNPLFHYTGIDVSEGPNVDIVMPGPSSIPLVDDSQHLVISGQMLEHAPRFWEVFAEMARVLAPGGRMILIAPSAGPEHRYPVDCYRYLPDSFHALATDNGLEVLDVRVNPWGPWFDLVGVFQKSAPGQTAPEPAPSALKMWVVSPEEGKVCNYEVESQGTLPGSTPARSQPLKSLIRAYRPRGVLTLRHCADELPEIRHPHTISVTSCPRKMSSLPPNHQVIAIASDDYFANNHDRDFPLDLVAINPGGPFDQLVRDIVHVEESSHPRTIMALVPGIEEPDSRDAPTRTRGGRENAERLCQLLATHRPDLTLRQGRGKQRMVLLITGLDSSSRVLRNLYSNFF